MYQGKKNYKLDKQRKSFSSNFIRNPVLMQSRIREVLLVSSVYEAFVLQEDGHLNEQLSLEFEDLRLPSVPSFMQASTGIEALDVMQEHGFDLVLVMPKLLDMDLFEFVKQSKNLFPKCPIVVLHFDNPEIKKQIEMLKDAPVDGHFVWRGDTKIFLAIVKYIEDQLNIDADILVADVRAILVIEDSIRYWSAFLSDLYPILMRQSQALLADGLNNVQKRLRLRTRAKIILAKNYDEALAIWNKYRDNILGVISDVGYSRAGIYVPDAGIEFVKMVRSQVPDIPVLLQSAENKFADFSEKLQVAFVNKNSASMLHEIRQFMQEHMGFGDFVFRLSNHEEVARAKDMRDMEVLLETVSDESMEYHSKFNHFSNWLIARSEFEAAAKLRPAKMSDFSSLDEVRNFLIKEIRAINRNARIGTIGDFNIENYQNEIGFQKIGNGSLGGKARSIAFLYLLFSNNKEFSEKCEMDIKIPQTFVVTTEIFDIFIENNNLREIAYNSTCDQTIENAFLAGNFSDDFVSSMRFLLEYLKTPLAIRSSSLLEDSLYNPFAGVYRTKMLANNNDNLKVRLQELLTAIKLVYASMFFQNAKKYIKNTANRIEEEKMAVIIQKCVGRNYGDYFYPTCSGVALSYNYYPIGSAGATDGVATIAFGMGKMVVEGGSALRFCPKSPTILPQFAASEARLEFSQKEFYAIALKPTNENVAHRVLRSTVKLPIQAAITHKSLPFVSSIYDHNDDMFYDCNYDRHGEYVITFNSILQRNKIPLAYSLSELLQISRESMANHVEIEFACDFNNSDASKKKNEESELPTIYVLQLRPILVEDYSIFSSKENNLTMRINEETGNKPQIVCTSQQAMGHGVYDNIKDIVYVKSSQLDPIISKKIAEEISGLNTRLGDTGYVLIGPGRWGSSLSSLGIPVLWAQISGARVIVEASPIGCRVEPSQGSHFFHNMTSMRVGYITIEPGATPEHPLQESYLDWNWLANQPAEYETEYIRHVKLPNALYIRFDGRARCATLAYFNN